MRDCPNAEIRDLLPEFVHRSLGGGDMARVTAHVSSCAECRAEVALLRSAAAALRTRPAVDVAAIVRALPAPPAAPPRLVRESEGRVVERQTGAPVARRRFAARWGVAAAAAAAAVIGALVLRESATTVEPAPPVHIATQPAPAAERGGAAMARGPQPGTVVPSSAPTRAVEPERLAMSLAGGPVDLTDGELEALLGDLEAMDALPSAEPEESDEPLAGGEEGLR